MEDVSITTPLKNKKKVKEYILLVCVVTRVCDFAVISFMDLIVYVILVNNTANVKTTQNSNTKQLRRVWLSCQSAFSAQIGGFKINSNSGKRKKVPDTMYHWQLHKRLLMAHQNNFFVKILPALSEAIYSHEHLTQQINQGTGRKTPDFCILLRCCSL